MFNPQMTSSQMELLPLVCLCLLSWSGTTSADQHVAVEEGSDVILNCSFGVDIVAEVLEWKKNGQKVFVYNSGILQDLKVPDDRFSHFKDELTHGNASLKIRNTKVADSGNYTCDILHLQSSQTVHVKLVVGGELKDRTGENIPGAAPVPFVTILDETDDWVLLQCKAHGVPDLEVHWQDRAGNILPAEKSQVIQRGGRVYITLNTTVTKTGHFFCVATQKNISHTISAEIYVRLTGFPTILVAVICILSTIVLVGGGVVLYKCCTRRNSSAI